MSSNINKEVKRLSDLDIVWLGVAGARVEVRRLEIMGTASWFWILAGNGFIIPLPRHPISR